MTNEVIDIPLESRSNRPGSLVPHWSWSSQSSELLGESLSEGTVGCWSAESLQFSTELLSGVRLEVVGESGNSLSLELVLLWELSEFGWSRVSSDELDSLGIELVLARCESLVGWESSELLGWFGRWES